MKTITAKSAGNVKPFEPTPYMEKWLDTAIELRTDEITTIANESKTSRQNWYNWQKIEGFEDWYFAEYEKKIRRWRPYLDRIGLEKAPKDYNYWKDMQRFAGRVDKEEENKVQVNIINAIQKQKEEYGI